MHHSEFGLVLLQGFPNLVIREFYRPNLASYGPTGDFGIDIYASEILCLNFGLETPTLIERASFHFHHSAFQGILKWKSSARTSMKKKVTSANLLSEFGKGPEPGETADQRKEKALGVLATMMSEGRISKQKIVSAPSFRPSRAAMLVLSTVNASYGTHYNAMDLADLIRDPNSASQHNQAIFAFFSEVDIKLQIAFLKEQGISLDQAATVARSLSTLAGYDLPLTRPHSDLLDAGAPPTV